MSLSKVGHRSPRTPLPTPQERKNGALKKSALFYQDAKPLPMASHGKGIYIYDEAGNGYIDACSGAISANLGHGNERVRRAADEQMAKIAFTYRTQFESHPANDLAELLVRLAPPELNRVFFVNSGSEAVETCIKLARQYWWAVGKPAKSLVISRSPSYHGATLGALGCTSYAPLNIPFIPMQMDSPKVSHPFCYHCPLEKEYPSCRLACARELEQVIKRIGADNIAAFIVEPIGGASTGGVVPPEEYFPIVEKICHDNGILLIVDDVLTGCGRTGTFFGFEHWDVTPDIVALSKGMSGGYAPIGACMATESIVRPVLDSGGFMHGHTFAGNPLSAAISREVIQIILDDNLVENSRVVGTYLHERLRELKDRYPIIGDVRGRGLLSGIEFVRDRQKREPFPAKWMVAMAATRIARENHRLIIYPRRSLYGVSGDHVLIAPPLIVTQAEIDRIIELFAKTLDDLMVELRQYITPGTENLPDGTMARYQQNENVPPYALGHISDVPPEPDANVTKKMTGGNAGPAKPQAKEKQP